MDHETTVTPLEALAVLELEAGASTAQIKQAYRTLAKVWHPDRFPNDVQLQAQALEKLKRINNAYVVLSGHEPRRDTRTQGGASRSARPEAESKSHGEPPSPRSTGTPQSRPWVRPSLAVVVALVVVLLVLGWQTRTTRSASPAPSCPSGLASGSVETNTPSPRPNQTPFARQAPVDPQIATSTRKNPGTDNMYYRLNPDGSETISNQPFAGAIIVPTIPSENGRPE